ncbi:MAG: ArnT family glycosyltransferase [Pyrinomonadaceae bacterium]
MRNQFAVILGALLLFTGLFLWLFPDLGGAVATALIPACIALATFRHYASDKRFVTAIFLAALAARLAFGLFVHLFELREFFGGDANTYDFRGNLLLDHWLGLTDPNDIGVKIAVSQTGPGWGMYYLVAAIYYFVGRNILAAQSFCAVFGAATAPMVYFCAQKVFGNLRVAKTAAVLVALFPAFIIWSGQLLKDGLIVFLLVLAMTMVLALQERFNYAALVLLFVAIAAILPLRFYIFYMVAAAAAGSFIIGFSQSARSLVRNTVILVIVGLGLTYFGVTRNASEEITRYGNLERLQLSRMDLARSGGSGFAEDVDVSTTEGAISVIPIGFTYLMFAPFPWEAANLRQAITLPEVLVWWAMMPLMVWGIWWAIRNRLRSAFPILIFSLMLTLAYSVFQGNVGTAYRQRTQIQVFLFIFIAVGWQLYRERKEDREIRRRQHDRRIRQMVRGV